jgi:hypothetical protein
MNDMLQEALTGGPVTVMLGGRDYPLAYPIQAVILYKQQTAQLDRERKKAAGAVALTREEKRELRDRRRAMLTEADALRPIPPDPWIDENFAHFDELLGDATIIKGTLDEDAAAGDSLYDKSNWWKISPAGDPERMLLALWVGLHKFEETGNAHTGLVGRANSPCLAYRPQLSREDLGKLVDLGNGEELTQAIANALRGHLIAPPEIEEEDPLPNVEPPATPAEMVGGIILSTPK